ncbi:MAG: phosphoenolpyruvate--protein phosphotransferase, partial [Nitrospinaceae bacterium]
HPAVLRALKDIFTAAEKAGKTVSICGELGGDPLATLLILGLGPIQELSMEPHAIPKVKKILRKVKLKEARKLAEKALRLSSAEQIDEFVTGEMRARFPSDFDRDLTFEEKMETAERSSS